MSKWRLIELLAQERRIFAKDREIERLRGEVAQLSSQNARIQQAMRRCVTCDYRLQVIGNSETEAQLPVDA
jgi:uncharacterized protein with PIN domain